MFARRIEASLRALNPATPLFSRTFSSLPSQQYADRAPALADVTPDGASSFEARRKQFRDDLAAAQERKEKAESQSSTSSSSLSSSSNGSSSASWSILTKPEPDQPAGMGLGSLSTANTEQAARARDPHESGKKKGPLSSLIYGTQEGRDMDREMEKSFSQVLARGKYVHSI
ncbi:hypothetical protein LTR16_006013, partial [Cryomyces antarcticus]